MVDICFVCLGNICRSPAAEGIARKLKDQYPSVGNIDSAGTGPWHVGEAPDKRMQQTAAQFGVDISGLRGRQVKSEDFSRFDYLVAMDDDNYRTLKAMEPKGVNRAKVIKLLAPFGGGEVPDPYYGGNDGFERTWKIIEEGVQTLFDALSRGIEL